MKKSVLFALAIALAVTAGDTDSRRFDSFWYDGNAEISVYKLEQSRYGQMRNGERVMVFVTEPMRLSTHIKPDVKLPPREMIRVIKLNDVRKFVTGIYDYSVMTSVFASVEEKQPYDNMATMKISLTSQEWCGQVFERLARAPDAYKGVLYSYFESGGETEYSIPARDTETEDNLWIRVRELNGPFLSPGERKTMLLIPSLWLMRKNHAPASVREFTVARKKPEKRETALGKIEVSEFRWTSDTANTVVYVEAAYPRRIVEFIESDGSRGKLIASRRHPYWKQNDNKFEHLRGEMGIGR